jgi:hypothetical protein
MNNDYEIYLKDIRADKARARQQLDDALTRVRETRSLFDAIERKENELIRVEKNRLEKIEKERVTAIHDKRKAKVANRFCLLFKADESENGGVMYTDLTLVFHKYLMIFDEYGYLSFKEEIFKKELDRLFKSEIVNKTLVYKINYELYLEVNAKIDANKNLMRGRPETLWINKVGRLRLGDKDKIIQILHKGNRSQLEGFHV